MILILVVYIVDHSRLICFKGTHHSDITDNNVYFLRSKSVEYIYFQILFLIAILRDLLGFTKKVNSVFTEKTIL